MDDFIIFHQVRVEKIGDKNVAMVKERIWRPLASFITWLSRPQQMRGFVKDGIGLSLITNMAIIVEGVIADIIDEYCFNNNITPNWGTNLETTWEPKKRMYNSLFNKKLQDYGGFEAIDILFQFRNNVAHGLAHIEESSIQEVTNSKSELKSVNNNYQAIREYFIARKVMTPKDTSSNTNHLWDINNAFFLWMETRIFIKHVLKENESTYNETIISEWEAAIAGLG